MRQNYLIRYCSQCKHSQYVERKKAKWLWCLVCTKADVPKYLTTNCTYAMDCELFDPERLADVPIRTDKEWRRALAECGISTVDPYNQGIK